LAAIYNEYTIHLASINLGEANASIASSAEIIIGVPSGEACEFVKSQQEMMNEWLREEYPQDPKMTCTIEKCEPLDSVISTEAFELLMSCLELIPQGVVQMSDVMPGTVETSNNVGRITTEEDHIFVSTHTRSFVDDDMATLSKQIADIFQQRGAESEVVMSAPAWQENQQSPFLQLVSNTFQDVLGWRPRMVAMHFVLEAGFFVQHYPGIQIASIGPRIVEPHSTSERVELSTIEDIWKVLLELLRRL
jgi:dipeptidase D